MHVFWLNADYNLILLLGGSIFFSYFYQACEAIGCAKTDLFQTVDLYESQNIPQVINGIHALGRKVCTCIKFSLMI